MNKITIGNLLLFIINTNLLTVSMIKDFSNYALLVNIIAVIITGILTFKSLDERGNH